MSSQRFYPTLTRLIDVDALPSALDFLKGSLTSMLNTVFFKDLKYSTSSATSRKFYGLTLITYKSLGIPIPGTDITFYLVAPERSAVLAASEGTEVFPLPNPTFIPVTVDYSWPILDLIDSFDLSYLIDEVVAKIVANSGNFKIEDVVRQALGSFTTQANSVNDLVGKINTELGASVQLPNTGDLTDDILDVVAQVEDELNIPMLEVLYKLFIKDGTSISIENLDELFVSLLGGRSIGDYVRELLVPDIEATLALKPVIEFPRSIFVPLDQNGNRIEDPRHRSRLTFGSNAIILYFSTSRGIGFDGYLSASFEPSEIGNTGLTISFSDVRLDLSRTENIPEASADGRGPDFVGVFIREATIGLPAFWQPQPGQQAKIMGRDLLIGTGGLSGRLSLEMNGQSSLFQTSFGGFTLSLERFDIRFHQGSVVDSNIAGTLTIPGFDDGNGNPIAIAIAITITEEGFRVAANPEQEIELTIPDVLTFYLSGLAIGKEGDRFYIEASGRLEIIAVLPVVGRMIEKPIEVRKLRIWSDGDFDFEGGGLVLPEAVTINVGPVELSVTAIHTGSYKRMHEGTERRYRYFGFDGGIKAGVAGVDARGNGIKYYFTVDDGEPISGTNPALRERDSFLKIEGISIDLTIPGNVSRDDAALLLKGWLTLKEATRRDTSGDLIPIEQYAGGVQVSIPPLDIAGGAAMSLTPSTGAFVVDINLEMATPIILGNTGLGIYGFRGLIGNDYVVSKTKAGLKEEDTWWEYYKTPKRGINIEKLEEKDGFTAGAGMSIATALDSGKTFSSKLFVMISLPGMFLLEGQAAILSKRIGLDDQVEPPFYAALIISDEGITAGFGVDLKIPEGSGSILDLDASLELAFFFSKPSAWYLHIGKDQPPEKRIKSMVLSLIELNSYLMISSQGIKAGAGGSWNFSKDFEIASIAFGVAAEVGGWLSFKPVQIGGFLDLRGYCALRICGIGFRVDLEAHLAAEAPNPFVISGSFKLTLGLPWPIPDIDVSLSLTWRFTSENPNMDAVGMIASRHYANVDAYLQDGQRPAQAVNMMSKETFAVNYVNPADDFGVSTPGIPLPGAVGGNDQWIDSFTKFVIPVDSWIDVEFLKPVDQNKAVATIGPITDTHTSSELIPPRKGKSPQVRHEYLVNNVLIRYWKPDSLASPNESAGTWVDYRFEELASPILNKLIEEIPGYQNGICGTTTANLPPGDPEACAKWILQNRLAYGHWQMTEAQKFMKLRVFARTPLEHGAQVSPVDAGFPTTLLLCPPEPLAMECQSWTTSTIGTTYTVAVRHDDRKLGFTFTGTPGRIASMPNPFTVRIDGSTTLFDPSLVAQAKGRIEIYLPAETAKASLKLSTLAENVVISYYRGYPYTPPVSSGGSSGGSGAGGTSNAPDDEVDRWEVAPAAPSIPSSTDSIWEKLRKMPGWYRDLCTGTIDENTPAGSLVASLLSEFWLTHVYLRQGIGFPAPSGTFEDPLSGGICPLFRETLDAWIVAATGSAATPAYLAANVEYFYGDMGRHVADYRESVGVSGTPNAAANLFYEKWMGLISCLGSLYDSLGELPGHVQGAIHRALDPEIRALYRFGYSKLGSSDLDLKVNPRWGEWEAAKQLRAIAGLFAVLSLDFAKIVASNAPALFEPYFERIESAYTGVIRLLGVDKGKAACESSACARTTEVLRIAWGLCTPRPNTTGPVPNPAHSEMVDAIEDLVDANETLLVALSDRVGLTWAAGSFSGYCGKLRRALAVSYLAMNARRGLTFELRYLLDEFYSKLGALFVEYGRDTMNLPAPEAAAIAQTFRADHLSIFECLCRWCAEGTNLSGVETYLQQSVDPEINTVYTNVVNDLYAALEGGATVSVLQTYGSAVPEDSHDRIQLLISFFMGIYTNCSTLPGTTHTLLQNWFTEFNNAIYTGPFGTARSGKNYCDISNDLIDKLEWIRELEKRRGELPYKVLRALDDNLKPVVDLIYEAIFDVVDPTPPPHRDLFPWELDVLLDHIYTKVINGDTAALTAIDTELTVTTTLMADLDDALDAMTDLDEYAAVDVRGAAITSPFTLESRLLQIYQIITASQPLVQPQNWPSAALHTTLNDFQNTLNDIADRLSLTRVSVSGMGINYTSALGPAVRLLTIATGVMDQLPIATAAAIRKFINDMWEGVLNAFQTWPLIPAGTCAGTSSSWLTELLCLRDIRRRRGLVQAVDDAFDPATAELLLKMSARAFLIADKLGIEIAPGRVLNARCRKARTLLSYFTVKSLDDTAITTTWLDAIFPNRDALETAFNHSTLETLRTTVCFPIPQPYDPLMKRETKTRVELLREIVYDDPSRPIDRIVIEPVVDCATTGLPPTWWGDYWNAIRTALSPGLIDTVTGEKTAIDTAMAASGFDPDSEQATEYRETRAKLIEELADLNAFNGGIQSNPPSSHEPCSTFVHEICWLPVAAHSYNLNLPNPHDHRQSIRGMDISLRLMTQPIWRPNTTYAIQIEAIEKVKASGESDREYKRYHTFGFRTAGPIGHYHAIGEPDPNLPEPVQLYREDYKDLLDTDREGEYKYADLRHYVDNDRSYPDPSGNVIGAKPLYYTNVKLRLFFKVDYVESMYQDWKWETIGQPAPLNYIKSQLKVSIEDPTSSTSIEPGTAWESDPGAPPPDGLRIFDNIARNVTHNGKHCMQIDPIERPPAKGVAIDPVDLDPDRLYTAVYRAVFSEQQYVQGNPDPNSPQATRDVYRHVFRTSRYSTFQQHIDSHCLGYDGGNICVRKAVYDVLVTDPAKVTRAYGVLNNTPDDTLKRDFALDFHRIVEGALEIHDLPPAETVEFVMVRAVLGGAPIGILVRSPEPLNDPRIPRESTAGGKTLADGLTAAIAGSPLTVHISRDVTAAFVTLQDQSASGEWRIAVGSDVDFTFNYLLFDGSQYQEIDQVNVTIDVE